MPRARGCPQCRLPTAELGESCAPNPPGETPQTGSTPRGVCCHRRAGNSRLPVPSHTRGGPGFCLSLRWPRCTPALLQNLPLFPQRRLSCPMGTHGGCHLPGDIPSDGVNPHSCSKQHQILHPGASLPRAGSARAAHAGGAAMPRAQATQCHRFGAVPLCCRRSIALGTAAWCSAAAPAGGCLPLPLDLAPLPAAPHPLGARRVPAGCPPAAAEPPCRCPPPMAAPPAPQPPQGRERGA